MSGRKPGRDGSGSAAHPPPSLPGARRQCSMKTLTLDGSVFDAPDTGRPVGGSPKRPIGQGSTHTRSRGKPHLPPTGAVLLDNGEAESAFIDTLRSHYTRNGTAESFAPKFSKTPVKAYTQNGLGGARAGAQPVGLAHQERALWEEREEELVDAQERRFAQLEDALAARESKREAYLVHRLEATAAKKIEEHRRTEEAAARARGLAVQRVQQLPSLRKARAAAQPASPTAAALQKLARSPSCPASSGLAAVQQALAGVSSLSALSTLQAGLESGLDAATPTAGAPLLGAGRLSWEGKRQAAAAQHVGQVYEQIQAGKVAGEPLLSPLDAAKHATRLAPAGHNRLSSSCPGAHLAVKLPAGEATPLPQDGSLMEVAEGSPCSQRASLRAGGASRAGAEPVDEQAGDCPSDASLGAACDPLLAAGPLVGGHQPAEQLVVQAAGTQEGGAREAAGEEAGGWRNLGSVEELEGPEPRGEAVTEEASNGGQPADMLTQLNAYAPGDASTGGQGSSRCSASCEAVQEGSSTAVVATAEEPVAAVMLAAEAEVAAAAPSAVAEAEAATEVGAAPAEEPVAAVMLAAEAEMAAAAPSAVAEAEAATEVGAAPAEEPVAAVLLAVEAEVAAAAPSAVAEADTATEVRAAPAEEPVAAVLLAVEAEVAAAATAGAPTAVAAVMLTGEVGAQDPGTAVAEVAVTEADPEAGGQADAGLPLLAGADAGAMLAGVQAPEPAGHGLEGTAVKTLAAAPDAPAAGAAAGLLEEPSLEGAGAEVEQAALPPALKEPGVAEAAAPPASGGGWQVAAADAGDRASTADGKWQDPAAVVVDGAGDSAPSTDPGLATVGVLPLQDDAVAAADAEGEAGQPQPVELEAGAAAAGLGEEQQAPPCPAADSEKPAVDEETAEGLKAMAANAPAAAGSCDGSQAWPNVGAPADPFVAAAGDACTALQGQASEQRAAGMAPVDSAEAIELSQRASASLLFGGRSLDVAGVDGGTCRSGTDASPQAEADSSKAGLQAAETSSGDSVEPPACSTSGESCASGASAGGPEGAAASAL